LASKARRGKKAWLNQAVDSAGKATRKLPKPSSADPTLTDNSRRIKMVPPRPMLEILNTFLGVF
jgi:hypothetical protein